jgi:parvulin-like peptidyl-prolyl isomerase
VAPNLLAQKVEKAVIPLKAGRSNAAASALAHQILNQLKHGANFAALAKKYSEDPGSAVKGGDLGTVYPGQTVPPFDQAAFHAPLKQYEIVHSTFGYHIVEVLSRGTGTPPGAAPGAKAGPTAHVRHILISTQPPGQQAQQQKFVTWLHNQEKVAKIKRIAVVK